MQTPHGKTPQPRCEPGTFLLLKSLHFSMQETTEQEVERVLSIFKEKIALNGGQPLVFFNFVIDPDSFSNTVKNIFHMSCLTWSEDIWLGLNEDKIPILDLLKTTEKKREVNPVIISINMHIWKELIETFQIKSSMIPSSPGDSSD